MPVLPLELPLEPLLLGEVGAVGEVVALLPPLLLLGELLLAPELDLLK